MALLAALCCCLFGWVVVLPGSAQATGTHVAAKKNAHKPAAKDNEVVEVPGKVIKEPNAFHGVKWGAHMASVPDLNVVEKDGQAAYATVPGVIYRIGDFFLNNVVYGFCQDRFAVAMVEYKGRKAHENIRQFLTAKYTKPIDMGGKGDDLGWPLGNVLIRMVFSPIKDTGTLSYFYQPLFNPCAAAPQAGDAGAAVQTPSAAGKAAK